jgi:hypothetical protein
MIFSRLQLGVGTSLAFAIAAACSSSSDGPAVAGGDAGPNSNSSGSGNDGSDPDGGNTSNAGSSNGGNGSNANDDAGPGNNETPDADTQIPDEPSCDGIGTGTPTWTITALDLPDITTVDMEPDPFAPVIAGFTGVAYGNGIFVAPVSSSNEEVFRWATSTNGVDWEAHSRPVEMGTTYSTSLIHFLNGKFVYFGELASVGAVVHTSTNGMDWTTTVFDSNRHVFGEFDANATTTVMVGGTGDLQSTTDYETFTPHPTGDGLFSFNDVAYGQGRFVASTNGGGQVFGSENGADWELIDGIAPPGGVFMSFGNGTFVAVGQGQALWTSPDGVEFTSQTPIGIIGAPPRFAGGRFVSWRTKGFSFPPEAVLPVVSIDGIEWIEWGEAAGLPEIEPGPQNAAPYGIADTTFGNCTYVMAGVLTTRKLDPERLTYRPLIVTASAAAATE